MKITIDWLHHVGACRAQKMLFIDTFGEEAELNEENFDKATKANFDLWWLAEAILAPSEMLQLRGIERDLWLDAQEEAREKFPEDRNERYDYVEKKYAEGLHHAIFKALIQHANEVSDQLVMMP